VQLLLFMHCAPHDEALVQSKLQLALSSQRGWQLLPAAQMTSQVVALFLHLASQVPAMPAQFTVQAAAPSHLA